VNLTAIVLHSAEASCRGSWKPEPSYALPRRRRTKVISAAAARSMTLATKAAPMSRLRGVATIQGAASTRAPWRPPHRLPFDPNAALNPPVGPNAWHRSGESYASHESRKGVVVLRPSPTERGSHSTVVTRPRVGKARSRRRPHLQVVGGGVAVCRPRRSGATSSRLGGQGIERRERSREPNQRLVAHRAEFSPHSWASVASSRVRCLVVRCATSPRSLTFASASVRPGASRPPSGSRRLVSRPSYPVPRHETREAREALRLR